MRRYLGGVAVVASMVALAMSAACSGSGYDEPSGVESIGGGSDRSCLDISMGPPAVGDVSFQAEASTCDTAAMNVVITDVNDVYAVTFDVVYDPALVAFVNFSDADTVLGSDGATVQTFQDAQAGRISISMSRIGSTVSVNASGIRKLGRIVFSKVANAGDGAVTFDNAEVLGNGTPPQPKAGINWNGGTFIIR